MFRELLDDVELRLEREREKTDETRRLLQLAARDVAYLTSQNAELQKKLVAAAAWEPPIAASRASVPPR